LRAAVKATAETAGSTALKVAPERSAATKIGTSSCDSPLELAGERAATIRATVGPLLALVGLTDKRDAYPVELSGGQKQRVGIARALAPSPSVLLCDEATSALDPETTTAILDLIKDINRRLDLTIILITHEMAVVKAICDRVAVLERGHIVEQGSVFSVFTDPQSATGRSFVREVVGQSLPDWLALRMRPEPHPGSWNPRKGRCRGRRTQCPGLVAYPRHG